MSNFVNKNNALQRSNNAHFKLYNSALARKEFPTADYHLQVYTRQKKTNYILSKKHRNKIYDRIMKDYKVID